MSKKIREDAPVGIRKDKRGLKEIPETLRKHARMSKRQIRVTMLIAGLVLVLLAAVMIFSEQKSKEPLEAYESAEIMKEAAGAERIDIINQSTGLALRPGANGESRILENGRRLLLLQRSGVSADDYWFGVFTDEEAAECMKYLANTDMIPLESKGDKKLWVFKAQKERHIDKAEAELAKSGIDGAFVSLNSMTTDNSEAAAADESAEANTAQATANSAIRDELMGRLSFIQYTINDKTSSINLFWGSDVERQEAEGNASRLQIIRMVLMILLVAAIGFLAYTLKSKNTLSQTEAKQRVIRLSVLCVIGALTAALVFVTVQMNNQNDQLLRMGERNFSAVEESEESAKGANAGNGDITFHYTLSNWQNKMIPWYKDGELQLKADGTPKLTMERDENNQPVKEEIITYMRASTPAVSGDFSIWRIIYYAAMVLIVALFVAMLYFYRYERDLGFPIINTVILIVLMIATLYPVLNTVAYSFSSGNAASRGKIGLLPQEFTTKSYTDILDNYMLGAAWISVAKTIITTLLNLFWTGMLAFTLTRKEYVLAKPITLIMVLTMYVNAGLIPNFLLISQTLNLRNSFWVYIIPTMFSCFNMIIIRTYIASLPNELVESARIDGAGDFRIYWQIIFPLCAPVLATVALFIAVGSWNSWFDTMLYNDSNKGLHTLQYVLKGKVATAGMTASLAQTSTAAAADLARTTVNSRTVQCATTVVTALPILLVYPFLQKYFVTGMALGSVKG